MNILISNLNNKTTATHLFDLFIKFGMIRSTEILRDGINGNSSGAGLVKMDYLSGAVAIHELNNMKFMNYYIEVSELPM